MQRLSDIGVISALGYLIPGIRPGPEHPRILGQRREPKGSIG